MILLLSPAKSQEFHHTCRTEINSEISFSKQTSKLIQVLKKIKPKELQSLMGISENLANLNAERYATFEKEFTTKNSLQAVLAFRGDVYDGLNADTLSDSELYYAQDHLRILSGLYGILRPLDLIQPYRLEMKTPLITSKGKNLYQFWGDTLTSHLNRELKAGNHSYLIQLASNEYFKAIQPKKLKSKIITPVFKEEKNGTSSIVGFFAKKARGRMARFILQNKISDPEEIKSFSEDGYLYQEANSDEHTYTFSRPSMS